MTSPTRTTALALLTVLCSCSSGTGKLQALEVTLSAELGLNSKCTLVVVSGEGFEPRQTAPMGLLDRPLKVGVFQADLPDTVFVQAFGFSDGACMTRTVPTEASARQTATFGNPPTKVALLLAALPQDLDGDGVPSPADCDDGDPAIKPGAVELCGDGKDNDCNGDTDCVDGACNLAVCAPGARCTSTACHEELCTDRVDNDNDGQTDCMDLDCDGSACGTGGACINRGCREPTETLCADNLDNDGDGAIDCLDPDCAGQSCSDGNQCTTGERCAAMACGGSTPVVCTTPPGACFSMAGTCELTTGVCGYTTTDAGCDDGNACTLNDGCAVDGGCAGTPVVCPPPAGTCFAAGVCQPALDAGCSYAALIGPCSDGNACTVGDSCLGDGGCQSGALTTCSPPECFAFTPGSCDLAGGCLFSPAALGTPCTGGACNAGVCVPSGLFAFPVDNVDPLSHPSADAGLVINCALTFNSGPTPSFGGTCPSISVFPAATVADGGAAGELVVLSLKSLTITDGGSFTLVGDRPVVLLVFGDATLNGPLLANSTRTPLRVGAGAAARLTCQTRVGGPGSLDAPNGKGGGGGGAGFFTPGADGGLGSNVAGTGGVGGQSAASGDAPLLVGCPGGVGKGDTTDAAGGRGGGAVQLSVAGTLTLNGVVSTSGQGGAPGDNNVSGNDPGGGGGGSGGALNLQAQRLVLTSAAKLTSNGGGGGGGAQNSGAATAGGDGAVATSVPALGGPQSGGGGPGGAGGAGSLSPVNGTSAGKGGGGGGGSSGRIFLKHLGTGSCTNGGALISPAAQTTNCP